MYLNFFTTLNRLYQRRTAGEKCRGEVEMKIYTCTIFCEM